MYTGKIFRLRLRNSLYFQNLKFICRQVLLLNIFSEKLQKKMADHGDVSNKRLQQE
jgi:hypothetical protein